MSPTLPRRIRVDPPPRPFEVMLVEPEIPPNTGNAVRLCAATGSPLHLVGGLGFRIDDHAVRRAGVDYWDLVELHQHRTFAEAERNVRARYAREVEEPRFFLFSGHARQSYLDVAYRPGDVFVFGRESVGLPPALLEREPERVIGIPLLGPVRSLNLANAVAIALYEALRQIGALSGATLRGQ